METTDIATADIETADIEEASVSTPVQSDNDTWLIALTGRKGSGKDTALAAFREAAKEEGWQVVQLSFAEPLKKAMFEMFYQVVDPLHLDTGLRGPSAERERVITVGTVSFTIRHALQTLGTEWGRRHLGADVWVNHAIERAQQIRRERPKTIVVITDARFENEFIRIKAVGGLLWLIERPEARVPWWKRPWTWLGRHASEQAFYWPYSAAAFADATIYNMGTIERFQKVVKNMVRTTLNAHDNR